MFSVDSHMACIVQAYATVMKNNHGTTYRPILQELELTNEWNLIANRSTSRAIDKSRDVLLLLGIYNPT